MFVYILTIEFNDEPDEAPTVHATREGAIEAFKSEMGNDFNPKCIEVNTADSWVYQGGNDDDEITAYIDFIVVTKHEVKK